MKHNKAVAKICACVVGCAVLSGAALSRPAATETIPTPLDVPDLYIPAVVDETLPIEGGGEVYEFCGRKPVRSFFRRWRARRCGK